MARTPSLDVATAEALLGPRGNTPITVENESTAKKWLTAKGAPGTASNRCFRWLLNKIYNDATDVEFQKFLVQSAQWGNKVKAPAPVVETPAPAPVVETPVVEAPVHVNGDAKSVDQAIKDLIKGLGLDKPQAAAINLDQVREVVREEIASRAPHVIEIHSPQGNVVKIEGILHKEFKRILNLVNAGENVMLVGPSGCGKTHLAGQIAEALQAKFSAVHGTAGASESALTGWLLPSDGGAFEYTPAPFVILYEEGESLFLLDEMDAFDANMLMIANGALANGHLYVPHRKANPCVKRGKNARIMATANTYGTGNNPVYAARNQLDTATTDRFVIVDVDYDQRVEEAIGTAHGLNAAEMAAIWELRSKVREKELRRVVSTRAFIKAGRMKSIGDSWDTIMATLVKGWTKDEKAKVGL